MKITNASSLFRVVVAAAVPLCFSSLAWAQDEPAEGEPGEAPAAPAPAPTAAQPAPAPVAAAPKIDVTAPEPPPEVPRSYHVHDGFYLRMNIGLGAYGVHYDNDVTTNGGSLALDVMVGGSPSRGLAIGGALLSDYGVNLELKQNDREFGNVNVETGLIGPFIDGFPNPKGGFHLGGMVGPGAITTDFKSTGVGGSTTSRTFAGAGGAAWLGYDAWVGDEWSVGGLVRFAAAFGSYKDNNQTFDARSTALTLMFTALYH